MLCCTVAIVVPTTAGVTLNGEKNLCSLVPEAATALAPESLIVVKAAEFLRRNPTGRAADVPAKKSSISYLTDRHIRLLASAGIFEATDCQ